MTEVTRDVLASATRAGLYEALVAARRPLTVAEGAELLGLAESTIRFHLDHLVHAGLVKRSRRRERRGRPENLYEAMPSSESAAQGYGQLARVLAEQLERTAGAAGAAREAARAAGRRWSAGIEASPLETADAVADVMALMAQLGFEPERKNGGSIVVRACPFADVAREHRAVVCGIHYGLLDERLRRRRDGTRLASLRAFVRDDPLLCVVRLEPGVADASRHSTATPGGSPDA